MLYKVARRCFGKGSLATECQHGRPPSSNPTPRWYSIYFEIIWWQWECGGLHNDFFSLNSAFYGYPLTRRLWSYVIDKDMANQNLLFEPIWSAQHGVRARCSLALHLDGLRDSTSTYPIHFLRGCWNISHRSISRYANCTKVHWTHGMQKHG